MHTRTARLLLFFTVIVIALSAAAQKRSITEKDLFQFNWIGDPQVSPDGSQIAFVKVVVDEKKTGYETSIWAVATSGNAEPHRLTSGKHDLAPRWSPDGKTLAFLRSAEKEGKPQPPQIALLSFAGGEAQIITDLPKGAGAPVWSPDGRRLTFTSDTSPADLAKQKKEQQKKEGQAKPGEAEQKGSEAAEENESPFNPGHESDVRVITRAVYRFNGGGYLDPKHPTHIWVMDVPTASDQKPEPRLLTPGKFEEGDPFWSKDGSLIYYTSSELTEPYYQLPHTELFSVSPESGKIEKITAFDQDAGRMSLSPDGKRVAFISTLTEPVRSHSQGDLFVLELTPGAKPRNLTEKYDYDVGSGVGGDNRAPRGAGGSSPIWSPDGRSIVETVGKQGEANLIRVDGQTGAVTEFSRGKQAVLNFDSSADGRVFSILVSTPTRIGDLFLLAPNGEQKQITDINHELFSQLNLTQPEEFWYTSFDGKRIQAWIQKPPDFDPAKKYPLILNIHGGPHTAYGYVFDHEFQWMAARGYVVLYPNPRGSTSYGQEFGNIIQYHYPGDDYKDLMAGVDELIKKGYIDPQKLGVTGGSGGGLLTNWVVGHTNRFAAAAAQRDIASWADWWYTADFTLFQPNWFKGPPFDELQDYEARSPITYIKNVQTPLMLVLGEADYRTPPGAGGEQMFRALKFLKRPTVMVRFPGESHELSRSGQPWHRIERLQHIVSWMDKYLLGKNIPAYADVTGTVVPVSDDKLPIPVNQPPKPEQKQEKPQR